MALKRLVPGPPQAHPRSRAATITVWLLTVLLLVGMARPATTKLLAPTGWRVLFEGWGLPGWMVPVVGLVEVGGSLTLLVPGLASYGGGALTVMMTAATATHLLHGEGSRVAGPLIFGAMAGVVAWMRRRDRYR